jgi:hypothetical protein
MPHFVLLAIKFVAPCAKFQPPSEGRALVVSTANHQPGRSEAFLKSALAAEANFGFGCAALGPRLQLDWPCPRCRFNPLGMEPNHKSPALELPKNGEPADPVS